MDLFASVGSSGSVIIFVCSAVGMLIVGAYFIAIAARGYLLVVQNTASGLDKVQWPDEAASDWIGQSAFLVGQLLIWLMPAGFLARWLSSSWLQDNAPLRFFILMGAAVWLLFPIGFLLTMASAQSGSAALKLLRSLHVFLLFLVLSGGVMALALFLCFLGLFTTAWYAIPLVAIVCPALLLIHARLVGRLGWLIGKHEITLGKEKPRKQKKRARVRAVAHDPWEVPEEEPIAADVIDDDEDGYGLRDDVAPAVEEKKSPRPSYLDEEPEPYTVSGTPEPVPTAQTEMRKEDIQRELAMRTREDPPPPTSLFFLGVWEFPFYDTTVSPWVTLGVFALGTAGLARLMIVMSPF